MTVPCFDAGRRESERPPLWRARSRVCGVAVVARSKSLARLAQQQIAHGAADEPRLLALAVEQRQRAGERRRPENERSARRPSRSTHSNRPGTMTPFSKCAARSGRGRAARKR